MSSLIANSFASRARPTLTGRIGAVSAADPLATSAELEMLAADGSAADAMIAAQAVLAVVAPEACGLGGDMLCLVRESSGGTVRNSTASGPRRAGSPA